MLIRDAKVRAAMRELADRVRDDTFELVAKHLEHRAAIGKYSEPEAVTETWLAAAREVREWSTRVQFNAITERIQP